MLLCRPRTMQLVSILMIFAVAGRFTGAGRRKENPANMTSIQPTQAYHQTSMQVDFSSHTEPNDDIFPFGSDTSEPNTDKTTTESSREDIALSIYEPLCQKRCGRMCHRTVQLWHGCYCDDVCLTLGDCCLDFEQTCLHQSPRMSINDSVSTYDNILFARQKRVVPMTCFSLYDDNGKEQHLLMVSSCRANNSHPRQHFCNASADFVNSPLDVVIPLFSAHTIYRNKYCALCNDVVLNAQTSKSFPPVLSCSENHHKEARFIWRRDGDAAFLRFAKQYCQLRFNISQVFKAGHIRYDCLSSKLVTTCDEHMATALANYSYFENGCKTYTSFVTSKRSGLKYKNAHCAICNGITNINYLSPSCEPEIRAWCVACEDLPNFSKLLDFWNGESLMNGPLCPALTTIDSFGDCTRVLCPPGQAAIFGDQCVEMNFTVPQPLDNNTTKRIITIVVIYNADIYLDTDNITRLPDFFSEEVIQNGLPDWNPTFYETRLRPCNDAVNLSLLSNNSLEASYHIFKAESQCVVVKGKHHSDLDCAIFSALITTSANLSVRLTSLLNAEPSQILALNHDLDLPSNCVIGTLRWRYDVRLVNRVLPDPRYRAFYMGVLVSETSTTYDINSIPIIMSWIVHTDKIKWIPFISAIVCELNVMSCETIILRDDEYEEQGGKISVKEYIIEETNYIRLANNTLAVCADILPTNVIIVGSGDNRTTINSGLLSLIGNIASMLFLILTLITYGLFSPLRNVPGMCIMNLCMSLFMAQLLFQLNGLTIIRSNQLVCSAMAAIMHYMWLVTFMWMNVLAFDISRVLVSHVVSSNESNHRFGIYAIYSWVIPAIFVCACTPIDALAMTDFSYGVAGTNEICWINGKYAVMYYFALPLAIIIGTNIVLFARTILKLHRIINITNQLHDMQSNGKEMRIYIRLTSVMGFTWLFGFLANIRVLHFFWYAFTLLNTLQGVFIFLSFVVNARVRDLYKHRFGFKWLGGSTLMTNTAALPNPT